jgi:DNA-binding NarL/FixJ family response regulator
MLLGRVIVADHQPLFREGICAILAQIAAHSGRALACEEMSSLAACTDRAPGEEPVDMAIIDLSLLRAQGMAGILAVRRALPNTKLVALASADDTELMQLCVICGVTGFLHRSARRQDIMAALQLMLDGGTQTPNFPPPPGSHRACRPIVRGPDDDRDLGKLSVRQTEVLDLVKEGKSNKQIAWELSISETTVKAHMTAILRKLGVNSRAQAIVLLQRPRIHDRESPVMRRSPMPVFPA